MRSREPRAQAMREFGARRHVQQVRRMHVLDGMSRVLIRCSTRTGRARQITEQLAEHMRWCGHDVEVAASERATRDYDVVVFVDSLAPADIAKLECSPAYGPM